MDFDGAVGRECVGIGILIRSPIFAPNKVPSNVRVYSYKLASTIQIMRLNMKF